MPTVTQDGSVAGEPSLIRTAIGGSPRLRIYQNGRRALVADDRRSWNASHMPSLPMTFAEDVIDQPARAQFEVFSTSIAVSSMAAWTG